MLDWGCNMKHIIEFDIGIPSFISIYKKNIFGKKGKLIVKLNSTSKDETVLTIKANNWLIEKNLMKG